MASLDIDLEVNSFYKYYNENYKLLETSAGYFKSLINSLLFDQVEIQAVSFRIKERDECVSKFKRKYQKKLEDSKTTYEIKNHITDLVGVRIVCHYDSDILKIKKILDENFEVVCVTDKIKDMESTENQFGYKSLHLDLKLNSTRRELPENKNFCDLQFEVQIRSIIQDAWSVLDHKIKYKKNIPAELKRRINRLAALFELADDEFYNIKLDTEVFEKETKETAEKPNQQLNIFSFLSEISPEFPTYQFIDYKADGFVHEILELSPKFTREQFSKAIKDNMSLVKKYNGEIVSHSVVNYLNPYTMVRHCLYLNDKKEFKELLYEIQRTNFNNWLKENK